MILGLSTRKTGPKNRAQTCFRLEMGLRLEQIGVFSFCSPRDHKERHNKESFPHRNPPDHFELFLDFDPTHRESPGVICGADLAENDIFG